MGKYAWLHLTKEDISDGDDQKEENKIIEEALENENYFVCVWIASHHDMIFYSEKNVQISATVVRQNSWLWLQV